MSAAAIATQIKAFMSITSAINPVTPKAIAAEPFAIESLDTPAIRMNSTAMTTKSGFRNCRRKASNWPPKISRTVSGVQSNNSIAPIFWSSLSRWPDSIAIQSLRMQFNISALARAKNSSNPLNCRITRTNSHQQAMNPRKAQTPAGLNRDRAASQ